MSVEGRIIVDALFHDKDGTNAINVLTLSSSTAYTSGKVISVSGTASVGTIPLPVDQYRDASGALVSISPELVAFSHSGSCQVWQTDDNGNYALRLFPPVGKVSIFPVQAEYGITMQSLTTGTYTVIIYGS